jgi:simple sugar transport system ATP-binding protein
MDWDSVMADAQSTMANFGFETPLYVSVRALSGGNLQRLIIAREMSHRPRLIIASYPTRGLDVQSALAARRALLQAREEGAGVLLISEDLDELFLLSDRLIVLYQGRIAGNFVPAETDVYEIGHLMTGSKVAYDSPG